METRKPRIVVCSAAFHCCVHKIDIAGTALLVTFVVVVVVLSQLLGVVVV